MTELPDAPAPPTTTKDDPRNVGVVIGTLAVLAAFALSIAAFLIAAGDGGGGASASTGGAPATVHVALDEMTITPAAITLEAGGALHVVNEGGVPHNLTVADQDLTTGDLAPGESLQLDLSGLAPGDYTVVCTIPGHEDAGMTATLTVVPAGSGGAASGDAVAASSHAGHGDEDFDAMNETMIETMGQFPVETEGLGNVELEPTEVRADGTKVFDLTAAITPWELSKGNIVEAWTYNGIVPGPTIRLDVGDRAEIRLTNELPIATDLHMHGLNLENEFDGVAPITQDPIYTGETFTYEYEADEVAVAMYHPHFHSHIGMPNGMFGAILVGEVPIPRGGQVGDEVIPEDLVVSQEFPMVLNDSGVIGYSLNGKSFPSTAPVVAEEGDWLLFHYYNEGSQVHPMHLHQFDQIVLARDGFPLDSPYVADVINVAPGERYSVLVLLDKPGTWMWHCHILPHVENDTGMFGMVTAVIVEEADAATDAA